MEDNSETPSFVQLLKEREYEKCPGRTRNESDLLEHVFYSNEFTVMQDKRWTSTINTIDIDPTRSL
jgi:hypothetical protein